MVGRGENHIVVKGAPFDITTEIMEARQQWSGIIKVLRTNKTKKPASLELVIICLEK